MLELIAANPLWFWLSLGGVLLAAKCSAPAATCCGRRGGAVGRRSDLAAAAALPAWQGMIFAVLTVVVATCGGTGCAGARRPHPADRRCSTSATAS